MDRGDYAAAMSLYEKALAIDPRYGDARLGVSEALVAQGNLAGALQWLEKTDLPLESTSAPAFLLRGQIHLELQQYEQAQEWFEKAARFMPRAPQPYYGLANASARLGEREKAAEYRRTFQELTRAQDALVDKSQGLARAQNTVRQKAARILFEVGAAAARLGDLPAAERHWRHAAEIDPTDLSARKMLVDYYESRRQLPEVAALLEQLVTAAPADMRFRLALASAYIRLGRGEQAEKALRDAHRLDPDQPAVSTALAQYLVRENRNLDEAVQLAQRAVELDPTAASYYVLSVALAAAGQRQPAIAAIEQALQREPGDRRWQEHYERLRRSN